MPYEAMVDGYIALYKRLLTDREIALRIRNQLRFLRAPTYGGGYSTRQGLAIIWHLVWRGIVPGGPSRIWQFLRTLPWRAPSQLPTVVADWIGALSMKEFAERRVTVEQTEAELPGAARGFRAQRHRRVRGRRRCDAEAAAYRAPRTWPSA